MKLGEMDDQLLYKIIDEAGKHLPVSLAMFFRGESLLHPKLTDYIKYAKQKGLGPIQLASNGLNLTDGKAVELLESGLDFISFSLDTNDVDIYKKTRPKGNLQLSIDNVMNFIKHAERRKQQDLPVPEIQVSTVDIDEYRAKQEEFIHFWQQYADRVRVYIEHSSNGQFGSITNSRFDCIDERKPCEKVYTDMVIYWDGQVVLCNHDWDNHLDLGNVKIGTIQEIWNSSRYKEIREMHERNKFPDSLVCKSCNHWVVYYMLDGYLGKIYNKLKS